MFIRQCFILNDVFFKYFIDLFQFKRDIIVNVIQYNILQ